MGISLKTSLSEISEKWKTGSLCRIGLFKRDELTKSKFKYIWTKSSEKIERKKWSWKNPGKGDWEIRPWLIKLLSDP